MCYSNLIHRFSYICSPFSNRKYRCDEKKFPSSSLTASTHIRPSPTWLSTIKTKHKINTIKICDCFIVLWLRSVSRKKRSVKIEAERSLLHTWRAHRYRWKQREKDEESFASFLFSLSILFLLFYVSTRIRSVRKKKYEIYTLLLRAIFQLAEKKNCILVSCQLCVSMT